MRVIALFKRDNYLTDHQIIVALQEVLEIFENKYFDSKREIQGE